MAECEIDALLVQSTPNVAWLTGYQTPRGNADIAALITDTAVRVVVRADEVALVPRHPWLSEVRAVASPTRDAFDEALADTARGADAVRFGVESGRYPVRASSLLAVRKGVHAPLVDATSLVMDLRLVKSAAEIEQMRVAAKYSSLGMRAAIEQLGLGKTDNDIGRAAYAAMLAAGSEAPYPAPFIMVGERTGWGPHLSWKRFRQQAGDTVNIELTGVHNRYAAPLYRTASIGKPSDTLKRVVEAELQCVETVLTTAQPYEPAQEIAARAAAKLDPIRDIAYCTGQVGYGVGLTLSPNWVEHSFRIIAGNPRPVVPGMAFHSPTAVRLPGDFAVAFSETWVMTETGPEILTDHPRELVVVEP
jgi:Xaa-Pro dipeptidase